MVPLPIKMIIHGFHSMRVEKSKKDTIVKTAKPIILKNKKLKEQYAMYSFGENLQIS